MDMRTKALHVYGSACNRVTENANDLPSASGRLRMERMNRQNLSLPTLLFMREKRKTMLCYGSIDRSVSDMAAS
jgi:hypothetical protein